MDYSELFKGGSLKFVREFVYKIAIDGFGLTSNNGVENMVTFVSLLVVVFVLYKLVWLVWQSMKFTISCLEW